MPDDQCDVVVVGGGIAGLTAASELSDRNVILLEADDRVGGRVKSVSHGDYYLNLGQQFAEGEGPLIEVMDRYGIKRGSLVGRHATLAWRGRIVATDKPAELILKSRLSLRGRIELARLGLRLRSGYKRAALNPDKDDAHKYRTELDGQPATQMAAGVKTNEVKTIFRDLVREWVGAEPEEITAGQLVLFLGSAMTDPGDIENMSLPVGGNQTVPDALHRALGDRVRLGARVTKVSWNDNGVDVQYEGGRISAKQCVLALQADDSLAVLDRVEEAQRDALSKVHYGQFLVAGIFTSETTPQPWDEYYAIATPGNSFQVIFNHAAPQRDGGARKPGGALVCYAGGGAASELMLESDDEITKRFVADMGSMFPGFEKIVDAVHIQRWPKSIPFWHAGERGGVPLLRKPMGPIHFAGDYLGNPSAPAAARAGASAAEAAARALA